MRTKSIRRDVGDRAATPVPRAAHIRGSGGEGVGAQLLELQRTYGNHQVQNLLKRSAAPDRNQSGRIDASIPVSGEEEQAPDIGSGPMASLERDAGGERAAIRRNPGGCDEPLSMKKVVAGALEGGLTMKDYYPDLDGKGYWQHGGTAGAFDTGARAGANVQLYGTIPSPCKPSLFSLAQTVTYTRAIRDGTHHPKEGVLQDDIAKSGRDASRPPFRLDWLGGGYNISMADPPSFIYGPKTNAEWDRSFVTSLKGPTGTKSVAWSTSIRIVGGAVTRNDVA